MVGNCKQYTPPSLAMRNSPLKNVGRAFPKATVMAGALTVRVGAFYSPAKQPTRLGIREARVTCSTVASWISINPGRQMWSSFIAAPKPCRIYDVQGGNHGGVRTMKLACQSSE